MAKSNSPRTDRHLGTTVVIKFMEFVEIPFSNNAADFIKKTKLASWDVLEKEFPGITLRPLIRPDSKKTADALVRKARQLDPLYKGVDFGKFFSIPVPAGIVCKFYFRLVSCINIIRL